MDSAFASSFQSRLQTKSVQFPSLKIDRARSVETMTSKGLSMSMPKMSFCVVTVWARQVLMQTALWNAYKHMPCIIQTFQGPPFASSRFWSFASVTFPGHGLMPPGTYAMRRDHFGRTMDDILTGWPRTA